MQLLICRPVYFTSTGDSGVLLLTLRQLELALRICRLLLTVVDPKMWTRVREPNFLRYMEIFSDSIFQRNASSSNISLQIQVRRHNHDCDRLNCNALYHTCILCVAR